MTKRAIAFLVLIASLGAPSVLATHPQGLSHMVFQERTLAPGETASADLEFGTSLLQKNWTFLVSAQSTGAAVPELRLSLENRTIAEWVVPSGPTQILSVRLPETAGYNLTVHNPSALENATIGFFFDQSCNCLGKFMPINITGGVLVFNVDVSAGDRVEATLPDPRGFDARVELATRLEGSNGEWSADYDILRRSEGTELHAFDLSATSATRYYFFVTNLRSHPDAVTRDEDLLLVPSFQFLNSGRGGAGEPPCETLGNCPKKTPLGSEALAVIPVAVALFRKRR